MRPKQTVKKRFSLFNLRSKLLLLFCAFSLVPTTLLSTWLIQSLDDQAERSTSQRIEGLAKSKAQLVDQLVSDRTRQVERIASLLAGDMDLLEEAGTGIPTHDVMPPQELEDAEALEDVESGIHFEAPADHAAPEAEANEPSDPAPIEEPPPPSDERIGEEPGSADQAIESLRRTLRLILWDHGEYEELLVIDASGIVLASTFSEHEGKSAATIEYFTRGKLSTFIQHVFISPITEQLTMVIATPIQSTKRSPAGVLAARLNLENFFRLIGDQSGLGATGETVVAKKLGSEAIFMAPTRHDDRAALKRKVAIGSPLSKALQDASRGQEGSGPSIDYREQEVFAAWRHVPSLDWGLVVKIDQVESRAAVLTARAHAVLIAIAIALIGLLCAVVVSRTMVRSLRELREATERISKGDLNVQLKIRSRDEIGDLADSFERMVAAIRFFRESGEEDDKGA